MQESGAGRWRAALTASLPVGMGYLPVGLAFGVLAVESGLPAWAALAMSVVVYAGALQFVALPLLAGGAGLVTLAITALAVNLRHILYALPLLSSLPRRRAARWYSLAALTDETYSLLTTLPPLRRAGLMLPLGLINQAWWVLGTIGGVLLGPTVVRLVPNLAFALPCLFLILALEQFQASRRWLPVVVALVALLLARLVFPAGQVLLPALALVVLVLGAQAWRELRDV